MKEVFNWFQTNKLSVTASKTNYMLLGTPHMTGKRQDDISAILDNTQVDRVKTTKFLGVIMNENFTRESHIDCVSKRIARNIGVMNKLKHYIPYRILHTLYCTLILPYLRNYGILIWGNTHKCYLNKIAKLQ